MSVPLFVDRIWQDVRQSLRVLAKNLGFATIAVISIAFGTGGNVAIFSAVDALLLRPAPVRDPDSLVTVGTRVDVGLGSVLRMSYADYRDVRDHTQTFGGLLAYTRRWVGFATAPEAPSRIKTAAIVSANYFDLLGVQPVLGRGFLPDEDRVPGRDPVVVLAYDAWQQEFGGAADVVGRTIRIAAIDFTVVGVAPPEFTGLDPFVRSAVFLPLAMWPRVMNAAIDPLADRSIRTLIVSGRLKPGVTLGAARAELLAIGRDLEREHPETNRDQAMTLQSDLQARFERRPVDTHALMVLSILSAGVLCVACANVAGLLASRAPIRAREIALRLAVGATRGRVIRQLMTESFAIALAGAIGGIGVGYAGIVLLRRIDMASEVFAYPRFEIDERTLVFTLAAAIVSVFLFGMGPAIQTVRVELAQAMKTSDVTVSRRRRPPARSALVAGQVALSLVLLTVAAFAYQLFEGEFASGPGFRVSHIGMMALDPSQARYTPGESARFFERVVDDARRIAGVDAASVTSEMPLRGLEVASMVPEGYRLAPGQTAMRLYASSVDEAYFETLDIPLVAGRGFRATDTADSPPVAVVNEVAARRYWPEGDVIGRRFHLKDHRGPLVEIVGIAKNTTYLYQGEPAFDVAYFPFRQQPREGMVLLARTRGESARLLAPLVEMVRGINADVPVYNVQTIERYYEARATSLGEIAVTLIGGLGAMGMTLTMVGLYGLVSYAVSRRTREIGIRMAIGAGHARVMAMVLRQGMAPAWIGLAFGLALSALAARLLPVLVPIGRSYDAQTFLLAAPLVVAVTLAAASIPARRAARVDPTVTLRCE